MSAGNRPNSIVDFVIYAVVLGVVVGTVAKYCV